MFGQVKIDQELWACETFILIKKPNVALEEGWKKRRQWSHGTT